MRRRKKKCFMEKLKVKIDTQEASKKHGEKSCFFKTKKKGVEKGFLGDKGKVGGGFPKRLWEMGATWEAVREVLRVKSGKGEEGVRNKNIQI